MDVETTPEISIFVRSDVPGASDGFSVDYSMDGVVLDDSDKFTVNLSYEYNNNDIHAKFIRIRYTNGNSAQSVFRMQTILSSRAQLPFPPKGPQHKNVYLENAGSRSMKVSGSPASVFSYTVPVGEEWRLQGMNIFIADSSAMEQLKFGGIAGGLTQGLLIEYFTRGSNYVLTNLKQNIDIISEFQRHQGGAKDLTAMGKDYILSCFRTFDPEIRLIAGDYVRGTVRDNLTSLSSLRIGLRIWRSLG